MRRNSDDVRVPRTRSRTRKRVVVGDDDGDDAGEKRITRSRSRSMNEVATSMMMDDRSSVDNDDDGGDDGDKESPVEKSVKNSDNNHSDDDEEQDIGTDDHDDSGDDDDDSDDAPEEVKTSVAKQDFEDRRRTELNVRQHVNASRKALRRRMVQGRQTTSATHRLELSDDLLEEVSKEKRAKLFHSNSSSNELHEAVVPSVIAEESIASEKVVKPFDTVVRSKRLHVTYMPPKRKGVPSALLTRTTNRKAAAFLKSSLYGRRTKRRKIEPNVVKRYR